MPDGALVAMPDTPDPELDARLHNAYVTQTNAKASGLTPGTPQWDKMTRGNVSMGDQTPAPSMGENVLRGAAGLTRMGINAVGAPLVSAATHAVMGAGHDLIDPRINPEGGQIHAPAPLGPVDQAVGNAIGHVTGALQGAGDTVESHLPQPVQHGADVLAQAAGNTAPLIMPGGEGETGLMPPAAAVARSPADVAEVAGYTGLKTRADMARPGNQAVTNTLIGQDAGVPKGTVPSVAAVTDARNAGPGATYNQVQRSIPKNLTQDARLQTGIKSLQDSTSQLPRSPDVEALQQTMLGQPDMTSQQLFSNIQQARERASANMASDDPDKNAIGKAYGQLADHYEDFAGRSILPGSDVNIQDFTNARTQFAKSYAAQAALKGGENFDPATYAKLAQNNPGMLTGNAAVVANVHNNLPAGASAAGTGHSYYAPMAAGSVAGSALGAGMTHLTGVPGLAEAGGLAGLGAGPMVQNALKNFSTRGDQEAATAAHGNPALSYFERSPAEAPTPAPLALRPGPGTVFDQLQREMNVPQGPGPNPDLKLTPPPGNARPVLDNQTDLVTPQGPGGVNKNLPQSPPGTGGLQPGLFDQIDAPMELAPSGAARSTAPTMFDQLENPAAQVQPASLPKGKQFGGVLYRGVPEGVDPQAANEAGVRFMTPNVVPEEGGTAASDYGDVSAHKVAWKNMIDEGGPADNAKALGLHETANQMEIAAAAKKAGYDGMRTKVGKGYEYADLTGTPAAPVPGIGDQVAGP
jgi:hypothetical protein